MSTVKAIVFDAYGTLFDVFSLDQRLAHHFGDKADEINQIWRRKQLEYTWLRSLMRQYVPFSEVTAEALLYACNQVEVALNDAVKEDLMQQYFNLATFAEVPDLLQQLAQKYKLAILSNANLAMLEAGAQHNQITDCFTKILSADTIQHYKPTPEVYQLAVDGLAAPKEHIVFVSSNTWDVAGASAFGLQAMWLKRGNKVLETLGFEPVKVLDKLDDLLNL
ncbi:haloacid dehalogenase, type II [marine bacterium AO1-C]|nr:haloacid dehalogenase, type II [marine bacterium AO1-C]